MKKAAATSILDDIPKLTFDDAALTAREIADHAGMSHRWARELANNNVRNGIWEKVFKRVNGSIVLAYRRA